MTYHKDKTYQGYTRDELKKKFFYDPAYGLFINNKTCKPMNSTKDGRLVIVSRVNGKLMTLSAARVALIIVDDRFLSSDEIIKFKDGDPQNLSYDNILVVRKDESLSEVRPEAPKAVATEEDRIFKITPKNYFVVRRGPTQAVYSTYSMKEAIEVRDEWLKDNKIHKWDHLYPQNVRDSLVESSQISTKK